MPDIILHRRSFNEGVVPTTASLGTAQFAINVADGKVFIHKSSSVSESIVSVVTVDSVTTGSINLVSGSFSGSGAKLYGIPAAAFSEDLYRISSGSATASIRFDISGSSSLQINTVTAISGGLHIHAFSGSTAISGTNIFGTASFSDTASLALTASYVTYSVTTLTNVKTVRAVGTILKGQVVRVEGANGSNLLVTTASYFSDEYSANVLGVATANIADNALGTVVTDGEITDIDLSAFAAGDLLYLGNLGNLTNVAPVAPLHSVRMGVVEKNTNSGIAYIRVDNGYELGELHDVAYVSRSIGDLLVVSNSVWYNTKQLTGSYGLTGSLTATGSFIVIGSQTISGSITVTGSTTLIGSQSISGSTTITGSTTLIGNQVISGSTAITGTVNLIGYQTISGSTTITGSTTLVGSQIISGSTIITGSTTLVGSQIISGSTAITGTVNLVGSQIISGSTAITGTVNLVGDQIISGSSTISGSQTVSGSLTVSGTLKSKDVELESGSVTITGSLIVSGTFELIGSQSVSGSIHMWQSASVSGTNIFGTASWAQTASLTVNAATASYLASGFKIVSSSIYSFVLTSSQAGRNAFNQNTGSSRGSILTYTVSNNVSARTGQIMTSWTDGGNIVYSEASTADIGDTRGVNYTSSIGPAGGVIYEFVTQTSGWDIRFLLTHI